ncbi:MAG TPA: HlyD family efflux transporter periplasmic adaptor subunit [Longimicrobiales bacterium]|nr:HlyD family efflux transporter periplasmic adaptor subunit [Longimicrobiales bacterium]
MTHERPRMQPGLTYVEQTSEGTLSFVVKDPIKLRYFRFGEVEVWLMRRMDGTRTLEQIAAELAAERGIDAGAAALTPFVARLKEMGLAQRTAGERRAVLAEALRRERRMKLSGHGNTLLRMRFSMGDPDALFDRWVPRLSFFWTRSFLALSTVAFAAYAIIVATHWDAFAAGMLSMYDPAFYSLGTVVILYSAVAVIILIHEMGHGLTCKRFGGEVHEMGAMLLYFGPSFYCNVNDAWTFEKRSERLWVTFAGGWIQLVAAGAAAVVWVLTQPGTLMNQVAFLSLVFAGGLVLLVNFNPLIPLDGYYALMDWLEIPNLRPRAFAYLSAWVKKRVLHMDVQIPSATDRERRVFLTYGTLSLLYTTVLLGSMAVIFGRFVVRHWGGWGWVTVAAGGWFAGRNSLAAFLRVARVWARDRLASAKVRRVLALSGAALAVLMVAALVTPWTVRARGHALVEPTIRTWLRAPEEARVEAVMAREGQRVRRGQAVIRLRADGLDVSLASARATVGALEREVAAARGRAERLRAAELALESRRRDLEVLEERAARLTVDAPFDAVIATPHTDLLRGAGATRGDELLELWAPAPLRLRILLDQRDVADVETGDSVAVRFASWPATDFEGVVETVRPASARGTVEVLATLADPGLVLRPGLRGRAKIEARRVTVAQALARSVRRMVRVDWLL